MSTLIDDLVAPAEGKRREPSPLPAPGQRGSEYRLAEAAPEVFVVDDDPSVRAALAYTLGSAGHHVRTFASASDFLQSRCYLGRGCLLLDLRLPDLDGTELYRRLQSSGTMLPVIFITGYGDIPTSVRAIKSGAVDFLVKPVPDEILLHAVDAALAAESRMRAERVQSARLTRGLLALTPREKQVLVLVARGRLNKEIAHELGISEKTVKVHRSRLMTKMGVRRAAQLVQAAVLLGLVTSVASEAAGVDEPAPGIGGSRGAVHPPQFAPSRDWR